MDSNINFREHINQKVAKANQMMGVIRRSFKYLDKEIFTLLYKSLVRPHLEYANSVWNNGCAIDMTKLENVQRRATKCVPGLAD